MSRPRADREPVSLPDLNEVLDLVLDRLATKLAERLEQRLGGERQSAGLDTRQAAARLGVSDRKMRELVMSGAVASVKVGRRRLISAGAIDRMLAGENAPLAANNHAAWTPLRRRSG